MSDIKDGIPAIIEAMRGDREASIIDIALDGVDLEGTSISAIPLLTLPTAGGGTGQVSVLSEIEKWRAAFATHPVRRKGTATLTELGSFIDHANRFKVPASAIFVSGSDDAPTFTSVLDYHDPLNIPTAAIEPLPRFGQHRGVYAPEFSPEWKAWKAADGKPMTQPGFAALITDHVRDVLDVTDPKDLGALPAWFAQKHGRTVPPTEFYADSGRMLELAEGLTISVSERVTDVAKRDTGETSIQFDSKADTSIAGLKVTVPVAFVIELPIFVGGARYQLPVRLRLSTYLDGDNKRAKWTIAIFGMTESVIACVADMRAKVLADTGLPVFAGTPE